MNDFPPAVDEKLSDPVAVPVLPPEPKVVRGSGYMNGNPSTKQQSYGALVSIIIIVAIVVIGALYVWGEDIANEKGAAGVIQSLETEASSSETVTQ